MELELELFYASNVPHIATRQNIDSIEWKCDKVGMTKTEIWLPSDNGWDIIPLKSIEMVGRKLSGFFINEVVHSTKNSSVLAIDYKKKAMFGTGDTTSTMIFSGKGEDIRKIKNFLVATLGFKFDAELGELEPEESRLLCLLVTDVNNMDILLPIFDGNKVLLNHAFSVLKKKGMVDEYATPTQAGLEYVKQIKGQGGGKLGKDIDESFKAVQQTWAHIESVKPIKQMNKVFWRYANSLIAGNVTNKDLWQFIPLKNISEMKIEERESGILSLNLRTRYNVSINVEAAEKSTIFVLYEMLNKNKDIQLRIMSCTYLGIKQMRVISYILDIEPSHLTSTVDRMKKNGLIDPANSLLPKGLQMIQDLFDGKKQDQKTSDDMFDVLRELKKKEARINLLLNKQVSDPDCS